MDKIIVTGADGFIGRNLLERLAKTNDEIFTITYPEKGQERICGKNIKNFVLDISDSKGVEGLINQVRPDKAFHLAAVTKNERSFSMIDEALRNNVAGTLNLFRGLGQANCKRVVNMSTCEVYGQSEKPFVETQCLSPMSPYSASKSAVDLFAGMLFRTMGSPIVTLRMTLVYGPHQRENMLIPQIIISALEKKDFEMTLGEQTRNFIYIEDVLDAIILASETEGIEGEIFNIGTQEEYKVRDIVTKIINLMNSPIKPLFGKKPYREPEIWRYRCNFDKARRILKWQPKVTLDDGMNKTINWYIKKYGKNV